MSLGALFDSLFGPSFLGVDPASDDDRTAYLMSHPMGGLYGKHWPADPQGAGDPDDGADKGAGGANALRPGQITRIPFTGTRQSLLAGHLLNAARLQLLMQQQQSIAHAQFFGLAVAVNGGLTVGRPHQPTELKTSGIVAGELVAWRAWFVTGGGDRLGSLVAGTVWEPGEVVEGDPAAGYGVHAFKSKQLIVREYAAVLSATHDNKIVYGEVALWGDVIEHEDGYRASHAKIRSLASTRLWDAEQEAHLREIYGVGAPSA